MKKIILLIFGFVISITCVYARDNRLYFTESENRIYYESALIDEKVFLKHTDMMPGNNFRDELIIENGTNTTYKIYFRIVPREQSAGANNLLEHINMKISIDGYVIYNGKVTGKDYGNGVNLQNTILLGEFKPSKISRMLVETSLSEDYDNYGKFNDSSYIDWSFYAQYDDEEPVEIVEVPKTNKNEFSLTVFSIITIIVGVVLVLYAKKKSK